MMNVMNLSQMRKAVFAQKPAFKRVLKEHGSSTLSDYFEALGADYAPLNVPLRRQRELVSVIVTRVKKLLSNQAAEAATQYFKKRYTVSTAAHHDFATHPFFANYLIAAGYANKDVGISAIPVLSCAGISLNNSSFPRGLLVHDEKLHEQRLKVISLKNHHHPVYGYPGYPAAIIPQTTQPDLQQLIGTILAGSAPKHTKLTDQITIAVHTMVKYLPGLTQSEALYLPQEEVASELFLAHHLKQKTIMHRIVFEAPVRALFIEKYNGIIGAHDEQKHTGSHLFWGLTESRRIALHIQGNRLLSVDESISIPLTPSAIRRALLTKRIMPTMGFTLSLLSFYYGLACAGGFSQVGYLTEMKSAYRALLAALPRLETEHAIADAVPTNLFSGEFVLATLGSKKVAATAIDIILNPKLFTENSLRRLMKQTSLQKAADRMMPELYKIVQQ